jgi:antitoxin CptB
MPMDEKRIEYNRLRWQCRRGLLELDLVFEKLFRSSLEEAEVKQLNEILQFPDNDLWDIVIGRSNAYEPHLNEIVKRLRAA